MTILALEFSSEQRSVAITRGNSIFEAVEAGGRSTAAFGMIERVLADAKIEREEIETIAVGLGPGSYTGIRSAIAMAQGWQLARSGSRGRSPHHDLKLIGVSSVEAIATQAQTEKVYGEVNVVVDAQRGEIYLARFEVSEMAVKEIEPLKIVSPEQINLAREVIADGHRPRSAVFVGPEATKWFPSGKIIFPRAATIAKLAMNRKNFVAGERMEPIYLREMNFVKMPNTKNACSS